jgi:hypothetical protein
MAGAGNDHTGSATRSLVRNVSRYWPGPGVSRPVVAKYEPNAGLSQPSDLKRRAARLFRQEAGSSDGGVFTRRRTGADAGRRGLGARMLCGVHAG